MSQGNSRQTVPLRGRTGSSRGGVRQGAWKHSGCFSFFGYTTTTHTHKLDAIYNFFSFTQTSHTLHFLHNKMSQSTNIKKNIEQKYAHCITWYFCKKQSKIIKDKGKRDSPPWAFFFIFVLAFGIWTFTCAWPFLYLIKYLQLVNINNTCHNQ